ncbi:hypothetical protein AN958_00739 [Leucoagaricus sp. SymC.cos]|nr:hypothetical protein AN958_00739 [Leucoagaricus sp. SymC.cos]
MDLSPQEVDCLRTEAENLEFTLQHLSNRRCLILRQINAAKSTARVLPTETLSTILAFACRQPNLDDIKAQPNLGNHCSRDILRFSHVSSRWRSVAFSIPQLWKIMTIQVHAFLDIQRSADVLALHFRNAKAQPFSLCVCYPLEEGIHINLDPITDILFQEQHSERVAWLELRGWYPRAWLSRISHNFPNLKHIRCDDAAPRNPFLYLNPPDSAPHLTPPNLESLSLSRCLVIIETSWEKITRVNLTSQLIWTCAQILFQCPNLVEFRCTRTFHVTEEEEEPIPEPFIVAIHTFPYLTHIEWGYQSTDWDRAILRHIRLPALKYMSWYSYVYHVDMAGYVASFFDVLSSAQATLEELHLLGQTFWNENQLQQLLSPLKHVHHISLDKGEGNAAGALVSVLTRPGFEGEDNLPSLRALTIGFCLDEWNLHGTENHLSWLSIRVVEMLQNRLTKSSQFVVDIRMDWTEGAQERVRKMIRDGADLKVLDDGEEVEWL